MGHGLLWKSQENRVVRAACTPRPQHVFVIWVLAKNHALHEHVKIIEECQGARPLGHQR
jgi:hypothetical protein